jgi:hypothetical protein
MEIYKQKITTRDGGSGLNERPGIGKLDHDVKVGSRLTESQGRYVREKLEGPKLASRSRSRDLPLCTPVVIITLIFQIGAEHVLAVSILSEPTHGKERASWRTPSLS